MLKHMAQKKLTKKEIKLKQNHWITQEMIKKDKTNESKDENYKRYRQIMNKIVFNAIVKKLLSKLFHRTFK